jgi:hypothetical protein
MTPTAKMPKLSIQSAKNLPAPDSVALYMWHEAFTRNTNFMCGRQETQVLLHSG